MNGDNVIDHSVSAYEKRQLFIDKKECLKLKNIVKTLKHSGCSYTQLDSQAQDFWLKAVSNLIFNNKAESLYYVSSIYAFSKAQGECDMKEFHPKPEGELINLKGEQLHQTVIEKHLIQNLRNANKGKLKRLQARINNTHDKYEALSFIALFYPRMSESQSTLDLLIELLGDLDLGSFKRLLALTIIYLDAKMEE